MLRIYTALLVALVATALPGAAFAASPEVPYQIERGIDVPAAARAALHRIVAAGAPGVTLVVARNGKELSRVHAGTIDSNTQYPIASASKWLTAATIMALVDEGRLSLDAPVSRYLPHLTGVARSVTLRQSLSQTTGVAGGMDELYDLKQDARITLRQSVDEVSSRPFRDRPGASFRYGAPGFQIAGAVAEAVTGQRWEEIFQTRIARPLGMTQTYWIHLSFDPGPAVPAAETLNPILQGGAVSTADDYMAFLTMLDAKGRYHGRRVLSARAVAEMHRSQTINLQMPPERIMTGAGYSLGNWCEKWDRKARCSRSSSVGAFGTYPWIDKPSGLYGVIFVRDEVVRLWPDLRAAQLAVIAENGSRAPQTSAAPSLVGSWRLVSLQHIGRDGKPEKPAVAGLFVFTADGRAAVQVMYQRAEASDASSQYAQGGYEATYGRYAVDAADRSFTFDVEGALVRGLIGKQLRRSFQIVGDELVVEPIDKSEGWRVVWQRNAMPAGN